MQRVAIVRVLVHEPSGVVAHESTSNFDNLTAVKIFDLMLNLNKRLNIALIIVTHDKQLSGQMDHILNSHNDLI